MIIDAFPFFDELDVLEIRLNELDPVVERFVIVESLERHGSSKPKPANLRENWSRFKQFERKMQYILLPQLEPAYDQNALHYQWNHVLTNRTAWGRENFQRQALLRPILELSTSPNDVIIISDCDEIPRATAVLEAATRVAGGQIYQLSLDLFYYNVTCYWKQWSRSTIGTVQSLRNIGPQAQRDGSAGAGDGHGGNFPTIRNAGWHFTYFGDAARLREKVESFGHSQDEVQKRILARDDTAIAKDIADGKYHGGSEVVFTKREASDPRLPKYFLDHPEKFKQFRGE